ncbi:MAG: cardiolipin synthase, partial [Verrucomicrobiales bacterium]|nr:cardiolipin synthase [Verrucomicrobiales bacterium]
MNRSRATFWKKAFIVSFGLLSLVLMGLYFSANKIVGKLIVTSYSVSDPEFRYTINNLLGPALAEGNEVKALLNGDQIFPEMLKEIRKAQKSITFENYIWASGSVSDQFITALCERAGAGVKIHCIVDGIGSIHLKKGEMAKLKSSGVEFVTYARDRWYKFKPNLNHRTHRKLLVVDGKVGFTGGACLDDTWLGNGLEKDHWRESHFKLEGPVVSQIQSVFVDHWLVTTSEVLEGPDYFPEPEKKGDMLAQCFRSGPKDGQESARLLYLYSIAAARKSIKLSHAYFVPDDLAIKELLEARKRGVTVEVIVPDHNDSRIGRAASRSRWVELINAGVKFYAYTPAMFHCKEMIVDDIWVTAGSVNFDNRSFRINAEANFNVLDRQFGADQARVFDDDKNHSRVISKA